MGFQVSDSSGAPFERPLNVSTTSRTTTRTVAAPRVKPATCTCLSERSTASYSHGFKFGNTVFHFDQQTPPQHDRCCKLYGIKRKAKRAIQARIPLKMPWFSNRITLACVEHRDNPWISVRLKNIVPRHRSPVYSELSQLRDWIDSEPRSAEAIVQRFELTERAVLSLYRDKKASPSDRDEFGRSHTMVSTT